MLLALACRPLWPVISDISKGQRKDVRGLHYVLSMACNQRSYVWRTLESEAAKERLPRLLVELTSASSSDLEQLDDYQRARCHTASIYLPRGLVKSYHYIARPSSKLYTVSPAASTPPKSWKQPKPSNSTSPPHLQSNSHTSHPHPPHRSSIPPHPPAMPNPPSHPPTPASAPGPPSSAPSSATA